jgi:hypothetical protein
MRNCAGVDRESEKRDVVVALRDGAAARVRRSCLRSQPAAAGRGPVRQAGGCEMKVGDRRSSG